MQGEEALFSENMPLRQVIVHLTKQKAAGTPIGETLETPFQTPQDTLLETGQGDEDEEVGSNISVKTTQVNDSITVQGSQLSSLLIIQKENSLGPDDKGVSCENSHNTRRVGLGTSRFQEETLKEHFNQDFSLEVESEFLCNPEQSSPESVSTHQNNERNSTCEEQQERFHGPPKPYKCGECPKIFRYLCHLSAHQRRHRNERPFVCTECHKGFFQASDLKMHQIIHRREKPFTCSMCEKSFSHKTNLQAHERIHTGEKPYVCSLCQRSYRQSSTYHRHLRTHQKITFKSVPSSAEASSPVVLM
ncbi:Zinc finger and SCAN domain-containing protein 4 [Tupaia chinensis]|uniref:Zinc finger and SCAN domain-containing protein 4 n=2 Tax=Tupaia chinensis TaxID=246437 RepID=L8Y4V3_TUPCH|nr:Zinc finger and SCAN domain-containing protein 4 [Tupaia chinensis]